ncbi:alpha/beta hydrolase [Kitasatospora sp. NBC_00374]|uniref:alpha/beta hydrolase family protein n=1 Tax=Kitasatospora sp. NBC_00374 TaxID=2975964 RepID=UPI0030E1C309
MPDGTTVAYGPHPDQVADLVLPVVGTRPAPLVVLLHGGFWRAEYDRAHIRPLAHALAARGYAVANTEYRRIGGGGGWPATFTDVALAADTLPDAVEPAHPGLVDRTAVVYAGHSAGGHLALWAALRDRLPEGAPGRAERLPAVAGVLALAPVADLAEAYRLGDGRGAVAALLGGGPDELPERYAAADPTALGAPEVPVVLVHGERDEVLPVAQARRYRDAFDGVRLVEPPGAGHFELIDPASAAWPAVADAVRLVAGPTGR